MQDQVYHTYRTAELLDQLCNAVDAARAATADRRWLAAIDRAWGALLTTDVIRFNPTTHAMLIQSATHPATLYRANGTCQCAAYLAGKPCYHRAAARLVRRALEADGGAVAVAKPAPKPSAPSVAAAPRMAATVDRYEAARAALAELY